MTERKHLNWAFSQSCMRSSLCCVTGLLISVLILPHALAMNEADMVPPQRSRRGFHAAPPGGKRTRAEHESADTDSSPASALGSAITPAMVLPALLDIDGSVLEGGGQIIRITSALSALLGTPIRLDKIRAGRNKGGFAAQHAAGLNLVGQLCGAALSGASIGSSTATMRPGILANGGQFTADAGTAGATMLMLQSALPCCCFAAPGGAPARTQLVLKGGTNVPFAPQLEYMEHVTLATMRRVLGIKVGFSLKRRGCFPRGGGEVAVDITPLPTSLSCFEIVDRGHVTHIGGRVWTSGRLHHTPLSEDIASACKRALGAQAHLAAIPINIEISPGGEGGSGGSDGCGVVLWAVTSTGCILGGSGLLDKKANGLGAARLVADTAVDELSSELCVVW